jgi:hypothetical protein
MVGKTKDMDDFRPKMASKIIVSIIFILVLIIPIAMQMEAEQPAERKENAEAKAYAIIFCQPLHLQGHRFL